MELIASIWAPIADIWHLRQPYGSHMAPMAAKWAPLAPTWVLMPLWRVAPITAMSCRTFKCRNI